MYVFTKDLTLDIFVHNFSTEARETRSEFFLFERAVHEQMLREQH